MGDSKLEREIVRTGTWCARMGGGGGRVGKSLRLIVLDSSIHHIVSLLCLQYIPYTQLTNRNHALSIVVQILKHHLT